MGEHNLTACPVCLRVLRGSEWIEVEQVIKELRSFVLHVAPKPDAASCTQCAESIRRRAEEPIAA